MWLLWLVSGLVFVALYLPVLVVALMSLFETRQSRIDFSSFTLDRYGAMLSNSDMLGALGVSMLVALIAIAASTFFALVAGYYMVSGNRPARRLLEGILYLPFVLPAIITGISMLILFQQIGLDRGLLTVIIGHSTLILAVIYRMIMVRLDALEISQIEASRDLGANEVQTFFRVVVPQLTPAIVTSSLLAFTISMDETLVTFFLVGSEQTLPIKLWAKMRVGFTPDVNALVTVILLCTFLLAAFGAWMLQRSSRGRPGSS